MLQAIAARAESRVFTSFRGCRQRRAGDEAHSLSVACAAWGKSGQERAVRTLGCHATSAKTYLVAAKY